ncbi:CGNR zinc finger domain-containing protein [Nonomuraea sp. NPDC050394]|uniref:CGNR zinc finger domain-containing protein n=1 Tax=Nonomuraea sp. NPDC050394 TaxID=3364363 RepID=UPI00378A1E6E
MLFSQDLIRSLATAVDLVNTQLVTVADLVALIERRQVGYPDELTGADLEAVRGSREEFHHVFIAPDQGVERLNKLLGRTRLTLRLSEYDGQRLRLQHHAGEAPVAEQLTADCGLALAYLFVQGEQTRLRTCAAEGCSRVFVDASRNRCRVYCDSRTCGNRAHAAAHRARRRT